MALDSILSTAILPPPPKSAGPSISPPGSAGSATSAGSAGMTDPAGASDPTNAAGRPSANDGANGGTTRSSSHTTHDPSESPTNTKSREKRPTRSNDSSGARAHSNASSRSKPTSSQHAKQTQDTKAARDTQSSTGAQQRKGKNGSFVDALAQSQADAAANATDPTAAAASGEITGTNGKSKDAHNDSSGDAVTAASLAFIPQSVAAVMAAAAQPPAQAQSNATASTDSAEENSLAALTANGKPGAQAAALTEAEKDLAASAGAASGLKEDAAQSTTPTSTAAPDASTAAAAAFQAHMTSHLQQPPTVAASGTKVDAPVGTPAFNDELGGKITWLANQGMQSASLQLSPEHLGPVNVHISIQDGSASVSFNAVHPDTRTALEQALPRLREMFATQGLTLTDANVSHQSPRGQSQRQSVGSINAIGGVREESSATSITSVVSARLGLVDTYA